MAQAIKLLIFDLDGTLIDSKKDIANAVRWTLRNLNLPDVTDEVVYSYVGNGVRPLIQKSVGEGGQPDFEKALRIFKGYYLKHLLDETRTYPGVPELLRHFRDRKKAILTNKPQEFTDPILKGLGLASSFDFVIGAESQFPKKPDPAAVHYLLKECQCRPGEAVLIGDSAIDIQTGKNAGIRTCGVLYGFRPPEEIRQSAPDWIVSQLGDLLKLIQ